MSARPLANYLTYALASRNQRRAALATTLGLFVIAGCAIPFGTGPLAMTDTLLPAVIAAAMVAMLVSAAMLRNQYRTTHYAPLALLSYAYSVGAALSLPYLLEFPHAFSTNGFGLAQAAPWFWVLSRAFFILLVGGYVWSDSYFSRKAIDAVASAEIVRRYGIYVLLAAGAGIAAVLVFETKLPMLVHGGAYTPFYHLLVDQLLLASACVVLVTLVARTGMRNTTHLWLAVVLAAFAIEIYLNGQVLSGRSSVAWYVGFLIAAMWQSIFLLVQLHDSNEQLAAIAANTITLHEEAQRDALTGVFNRRGYGDRYEYALAESQKAGASIALLVIDVDYFKKFNDYFGHLVGDEALRSVAGAMTNVVNRPGDAVCRMGGDEFVIILAATDERGATSVAERIRATIMRLRIRNAPDAPIPTMSVSIGIAVGAPKASDTATALYERADKALYRAKNFGRNRVVGSSDACEVSLRVV